MRLIAIAALVAAAWLVAPAARAAHLPLLSRFASATLFVDGRTNAVTVLRASNVAVKIVPAQYQDLKIARAFDIVCDFPAPRRIARISARVDRRFNLIPIDVVDYKEDNPSYMKLEVNELYLSNRIADPRPRDHMVYLDFIAAP